MNVNYRFFIFPVTVGKECFFQLRVGMNDDGYWDYIPVHESAFATRLPLQPTHVAVAEAQLELTQILNWLGERWMFPMESTAPFAEATVD